MRRLLGARTRYEGVLSRVPLARFDDAIWADPVFPTFQGLIRVRDDPDALVIERATLWTSR